MIDFVNTVDSVGDEALTNSIIDRSITEIRDNRVTSIGISAFQSCYNLTTADFPASTSIGSSAFQSCSKLTAAYFPAAASIGNDAFTSCRKMTKADFPAATSIGNSAFESCAALKTLILRSGTMATLGNTNAFYETPISSGTGYIYVPAALVDSYKAASNWSTYANQIRAIENYPEICGT